MLTYSEAKISSWCNAGGSVPGLRTGTLWWSRYPTTPDISRAGEASTLMIRALARVLVTKAKYNSPGI